MLSPVIFSSIRSFTFTSAATSQGRRRSAALISLGWLVSFDVFSCSSSAVRSFLLYFFVADMLLFFISLVSITGLTVAAKLPPTLVLKCNEYPGVVRVLTRSGSALFTYLAQCDTHCYAAACTVGQSPSATDVTRYLHYSKDADQNEVGGGHTSDEASSRRTVRPQVLVPCRSLFRHISRRLDVPAAAVRANLGQPRCNGAFSLDPDCARCLLTDKMQ